MDLARLARNAQSLPQGTPSVRPIAIVAVHCTTMCRRLARAVFMGRVPAERACRAMFLGQTLDMLNVAAGVLGRFESVVWKSPGAVPSLAMVNNLMAHFPAGETPLSLLRRAVESGPNYAEAWCEYGRLLLKERRYADAISAFERALVSASYADPDRNPESIYEIVRSVYVKALFWMGQAWERAGDDVAAVKAYSRALVLQPGLGAASLALADLYYRRGALEASLACYGAAMTYSPLVVALPRIGRDLESLAGLIEQRARLPSAGPVKGVAV